MTPRVRRGRVFGRADGLAPRLARSLAQRLALALLLSPMPGVGSLLAQSNAVLASQPATPIALRTGDHPGFGRIVIDLGDRPEPDFTRRGDMLTISIVGSVPGDLRLPRNVRSVVAEGGNLSVRLAAGSVVRKLAMERKLVLDILDPSLAVAAVARTAPPAAEPPARAAIARPAKPTLGRPEPAAPVRPRPAEAKEATTSVRTSPPAPAATTTAPIAAARKPDAATEPKPPPIASPPVVATPLAVASQAPPSPVTSDSQPSSSQSSPPAVSQLPPPTEPISISASIQPNANDRPGHALSVPFEGRVGAAAFQRGRYALVVFDARRPVDLHAVQDDPVFSGAELRLLPAATVLQMHLPPGAEIRLSRMTSAWIVTAIGSDVVLATLTQIMPQIQDNAMLLPVAEPGMVVSVPDPQTGGVLLVGTQRKSGQGVAVARRGPDFALLPSWQGVVVEPVSDAVSLRAAKEGFVVAPDGEDRHLVMSPAVAEMSTAAEASRLSRRFDFPAQRTVALLRRLQGAVAAAASAPVQSRVEPRKQVAEAMLALGLGIEAQAVLDLAIKDDARAADDPGLVGLTAIAGLLSERADTTGALADPRLDGTDEIQFWRAVKQAQGTPGSPVAAQVFANTLPLLLDYPQTLRQRLLPLVAETMATGGQAAIASGLLDGRKDDPTLDMARAMLHQAKGGDITEALALYDRLAQSSDRKIRITAAERGAELRLVSGLATPAQTAEVLGKLLYSWRDDTTEIDRRLRVAELLAASGQFRPALQLLRETLSVWPERKDIVGARLSSIFRTALTPAVQAKMPPFDLVTLAQENADLIPAGDVGQALAERVSDRLTELDLPERAAPMLERLMTAAGPGVARATFGAHLAAARLQLNDPVGAVQALTTSTTETLSPGLLESRTLTFAAAVAAQHDLPSAERALMDLDTPSGDALMARLREEAQDWPGAVVAWSRTVARTFPRDGLLDPGQAGTLVRLAGAAAQAADNATLSRLGAQYAGRLAPGQLADTFNLLTAGPVATIADLPRVTKDVALVKAVPAALAAMIPPPAASATQPIGKP